MFTEKSKSALKEFITADEKYLSYLSQKAPKESLLRASISDEDGEIKKYYTLNNSGNIMISSTVENEANISADVKSVFQKVIVFFGAWTSALNKAGKTLYDADAITSMIEGSGYFVRVHQEERTFNYTSAQGTLNTAIIGSILSGFSAMGSALKIAQNVVGAMGNEISISLSRGENTKKIGHLLFICENLMGMPIINVALLNTTARESETVSKSNCHTTVQKTMAMTYRQDLFLFVDPTYINKFSQDFETNPDYDALIEKLVSYIK